MLPVHRYFWVISQLILGHSVGAVGENHLGLSGRLLGEWIDPSPLTFTATIKKHLQK